MLSQRLLHALFFTPNTSDGTWRGAPLLLWGPPGTGKTSIARQFAKRVNIPCEIAPVGARGEGFFGVIPVARGEGDDLAIHFPKPFWTKRFHDLGLVLNDEFTTAKGEMKAALLTLTLDGEICGHVLAPRVRVWAAANPIECSADGEELSPPNANRMIHLTSDLDVQSLCQFLVSGPEANGPPIDAKAEEDRVMQVWGQAEAKAAGKIAAFLTRHPDLAHKMPAEGDPNRGRAWPSPRSWQMAIRMLAASEVHDLREEERDTLGAGCVGEHAWQEFCNWLAAMDLPDPASVLDNANWVPDARRLDVTAAVLASCAAIVAPKDAPKRLERANALWRLLDKVGTMGARDLTVQPSTTLVKAGLIASPEAQRVLASQRLGGLTTAIK